MNEKKVIYGLVKYPELTVAKLSKAINISVPTLCKLRKNLINKGILKIVNIPDLGKIGMELLVLSHGRFTHSPKGKTDCKPCNPNKFFSITTKTDCAEISAYEDYTQAKAGMENYSCGGSGRTNKPVRIIIPIGDIKAPKMEFAPLVKKIFGL